MTGKLKEWKRTTEIEIMLCGSCGEPNDVTDRVITKKKVRDALREWENDTDVGIIISSIMKKLGL